jgi:hypothetical protein
MKLVLPVSALCLATLVPSGARGAEPAATHHRVYSHRMNPREHPDDSRRYVWPPDRAIFGGRVHFTALRDSLQKDGELVGFREEIDKYMHTLDLGETAGQRSIEKRRMESNGVKDFALQKRIWKLLMRPRSCGCASLQSCVDVMVSCEGSLVRLDWSIWR